jgi:hypothetical protein
VSETIAIGRCGGVVAAVCAALLAVATPAMAAPEWSFGNSESSTVVCPGVDGPRSTPGIQAATGILVDPQALPEVGEVFYGGVIMGTIAPCVASSAGVEVVPPTGVELAVSPQTPIRCAYLSRTTPVVETELTPAQGCGQQPEGGFFGPRRLLGPGVGGTWPLHEPGRDILVIGFPLRSARPLSGSVTIPGCRRTVGELACPPERAGDNLQVLLLPIDGGVTSWLAPHMGLFVQPAPVRPQSPPTSAPSPSQGAAPPSSAPAPALLVRVPRSMRIARALAGVRIAVRVPVAGATVGATLRARGVPGLRDGRVAAMTRRNARAGLLALRLRPTRAAARALRRVRRVRLTLRVTVRVAGRPARTQSAPLLLHR